MVETFPGALPPDGACVLGVTMVDLWSGGEDVFTSGLACFASHTGIFSFRRYGDGDASARLARASSTAAHEVCHS